MVEKHFPAYGGEMLKDNFAIIASEFLVYSLVYDGKYLEFLHQNRLAHSFRFLAYCLALRFVCFVFG